MTDEETAFLRRLQIAMWLPAACAYCGKPYRDVDDFEARRPRCGKVPFDPAESFVDSACWTAYQEAAV